MSNEKKSSPMDGGGSVEEWSASDVEKSIQKDTGGNTDGTSDSGTVHQEQFSSQTASNTQTAALNQKEQVQAAQVAARQQLIMQAVSNLPEFMAGILEFKQTVEKKMEQVDVVSSKLGAIIDAYEKRQKEAQGAGGTVAGQQQIQPQQYAQQQYVQQQGVGAVPAMGIPGMVTGPDGRMMAAEPGHGGGGGTGNALMDAILPALVGEVSKGLTGGGTNELFMKMMMENMMSMMTDSFSLNKEISVAIRRRLAQGVVNDVLGIKADTTTAPANATPVGSGPAVPIK